MRVESEAGSRALAPALLHSRNCGDTRHHPSLRSDAEGSGSSDRGEEAAERGGNSERRGDENKQRALSSGWTTKKARRGEERRQRRCSNRPVESVTSAAARLMPRDSETSDQDSDSDNKTPPSIAMPTLKCVRCPCCLIQILRPDRHFTSSFRNQSSNLVDGVRFLQLCCDKATRW